jgi:hypothetical protein
VSGDNRRRSDACGEKNRGGPQLAVGERGAHVGQPRKEENGLSPRRTVIFLFNRFFSKKA